MMKILYQVITSKRIAIYHSIFKSNEMYNGAYITPRLSIDAFITEALTSIY